MGFLNLDAAAQERLEALRVWAEAHPKTIQDSVEADQGRQPFVGEQPQHVVRIEEGWTVVFSVEDHGRGLVRHASVSRRDMAEGKAPNPIMVAGILKYLGYRLRDQQNLPTPLAALDGIAVFPSAALGWQIPHLVQPVADRPLHEEGQIAAGIFHEHLDAHPPCNLNPMNLCRLGAHLLERAARGLAP